MNVAELVPGQRVTSPRGGVPCIVAYAARNAAGEPYALLTSDGGIVHGRWHTGPESGSSIYYEHVGGVAAGCHGWADAVSRDTVQTG